MVKEVRQNQRGWEPEPGVEQEQGCFHLHMDPQVPLKENGVTTASSEVHEQRHSMP